jgi:thiol:disulfide interchange protein DsbD
MKNIIRFTLLFLGVLCATVSNAQETPVKWKLNTTKISACEYELVFSGAIDEGWHVYSLNMKGDDGPMPSRIVVKPSPDYETIGKATEGKAIKGFDKVFEMDVAYFEKTVTFKQKIKIKTDKAVKISGTYEYQACTEEKCIFPPAEEFSFDLKGSAECLGSKAAVEDPATSKADCDCDTSAILKLKSAATTPLKDSSAITKAEPSNKNEATSAAAPGADDCNPWSTLLLGLGFGLGAVLMPCIYSLIPLTVSFFLKQNKSRTAAIKSSFLYGFFITFIFVALTMGITIIFGPAALSNIATNTWLNLFFFVLFVVFALSFFGLFEITLPSSWANKMDAKADSGGTLGIFFMALTLVIVSFSCTVGFMGGLITAVSRGDSYLCPLMGFTGFGAGIAMPFMLFALFPSWLKTLPKSGGWMTTFKVTIAFLELALAIKFLTNADNVNEWGLMTREVFIALWIAIFAMLTFYLLGVFRTSHDDPKSHLSIGRIMWGTFFMAFTLYMIPGLWGAPLKLISSFPPPHYYAESPNGIGGHSGGNTQAVQSSGAPEQAALEALRVHGPDGLMLFKDDYDSALKYAKLVKKPLFIDFTGKACVNCRLMESNVWIKPEVISMLRDSMVIVSLYVDSKVALPEAEQKKVHWYGKERTLSTIGDKWAYFQTTKYNSSSQPLYVLINHDESNATNGTKGTELDEQVFAAWLRDGLQNFKK